MKRKVSESYVTIRYASEKVAHTVEYERNVLHQWNPKKYEKTTHSGALFEASLKTKKEFEKPWKLCETTTVTS